MSLREDAKAQVLDLSGRYATITPEMAARAILGDAAHRVAEDLLDESGYRAVVQGVADALDVTP